MSRQTINDYVKAEPFKPFRLHLVSGRTFEIRHPELMKILQSTVIIFKSAETTDGLSDEWDTVSMMLIESISHLEAPVH
jgi:hypothetical protein